MKSNSHEFKTESVKEFLARGGQIKRIPSGRNTKKVIKELEKVKKKFSLEGNKKAVKKIEEMIVQRKSALSK